MTKPILFSANTKSEQNTLSLPKKLVTPNEIAAKASFYLLDLKNKGGFNTHSIEEDNLALGALMTLCKTMYERSCSLQESLNLCQITSSQVQDLKKAIHALGDHKKTNKRLSPISL